MQPINYSIDVQSPFEAAMKGYNATLGQRQELIKTQLAQDQMDQTMRMRNDLNMLAQKPNPTAQDYAAIMTKYPEMAQNIQRGWGLLSDEQRKNRLSQISQVDAALQSGNNQVAMDLLKQQAEAYRNSGNEKEAAEAESLLNQIKTNPAGAKIGTASALAVVLGLDNYAANLASIRKTPSDVAKSEAEATQKGLEADNAPEKMALDNAKAAEDIQTKRLDRKLNILTAKINAADSETKRGQLQAERDKIQLERDKLVEKTGQAKEDLQAKAQSHLDTINMGLETIKRVKENPQLEGGWTGVGSVIGAISGYWPGTNRVALEDLIKTLQSQQFIDSLKQLKSESASGATGLGNLSNAEGDRLVNQIATLNPNGEPKAQKAAIESIQKTLERIQQRLIAQGNLPTTNQGIGNTFVMRDPQLGVITDAMINKILTAKPGMTREQAIEYFKQRGAK